MKLSNFFYSWKSFIPVLLVFTFFGTGCRHDSSGVITLTMYNYRDPVSPEAFNWTMLVEEFRRIHPNIHLKVEEGFNVPYHDKLRAMAEDDDLPDLVYLWPGKKTGHITSRGFFKDLRPYLAGHEDEFQDIALYPQGPDGEIYELPQTVTACHIMYMNTALMKQLGLSQPKTLDELIAQGEVIRNAGLIPISMANKEGWQMQSTLLSTLMERSGGMDWYTRVIHGRDASFTDPEFIHALEIVKRLHDNKMFTPDLNTNIYDQSVTDFINGKAVYYIDGAWKMRGLKASLTIEQLENIDFMTFPDIPNQKGKSGSTAAVPGCGFGMNAKLKGAKADAAWEWIWFYAGPEGSKLNQKHGLFTAYILPPLEGADPIMGRFHEFIKMSPMGYVLDNKMDRSGLDEVLQADIQSIMDGKLSTAEAAMRYEAWVDENDASRQLFR